VVTTIYPLPRIEYQALEHVRERRPAALFTSGPAWEAVGGVLELPIVWRTDPGEAAEATFEALAADIPEETEVIYAVGGGLPFDAAKLAALRRGLPLVGVPTALSTDAPLTPASGVRRDGCVFYIPTGAPDLLYIDWDLIASAPPFVRASGFAEMMAITVGLWDWRFAETAGMNPADQRHLRYCDEVMRALHEESLRIARAAGEGEVMALQRLLEGLALQVQLCSGVGHSRAQEGSEHYFAYAVENLTGHGLPHSDLIGPGIVGMAAAQGQDPAPLREALLAAGVRLDQISADHALAALRELPAYSTRHGLPYGIAHAMTPERIDTAMRAMAG
jgi:glycerol-1-phosphate dehydrogenase [NAD(P)+]